MQGPGSLSTHSVYPERALEGSVCAEAQRGGAGIQHCPDERASKAVTMWVFSLFLYLVYKADNLGKHKWCAAVSERILTFQSCQKCDVERHTHEKTLEELLGIISAAAIYDFKSVTVFQCLKLSFSHVNLCMVLLSDNQ